MTRTLVCVLTLAAGLAAREARAQPKAEASARFAEGASKYDAADYLGAADKFKDAYASDPDPSYLFNIAQAYRFANDCADAADYYRRFLVAVSQPPNVDKVKGWLRDEEMCARVRADQGSEPAASAPAAAQDHPTAQAADNTAATSTNGAASVRTASAPVEVTLVAQPGVSADIGRVARHRAYFVAGVGAGLLVAEAVVGLVARHVVDDDASVSYASQTNWKNVVRYGGTTAFVVGTAAIATGIVLYVRARHGGGVERVHVTAAASPSSLAVALDGAF
jgi:hypothetical protein